MKRIGIVMLLVLVLGMAAYVVSMTQREGEYTENQETNEVVQVEVVEVIEPVPYEIDESDYVDGAALIEEVEQADGLTESERAGLLLMREEEKLARDVYSTLYDRWNLRIFSNIAASEQTHMDAMQALLERYDIEDPVVDDAIGEFTDPTMQELYVRLVEQGERSLQSALAVGAMIEDLDIFDLERLMGETDKSDIIAVYANLQKGSRNHLRAFVAQIERRDEAYVPQYISQEEYDRIIGSAQERGRI